MLKRIEFTKIYSAEYYQEAWQVTKTLQDDSRIITVKDPYDDFSVTDALGWLASHGYRFYHTRWGWAAYPAPVTQ
jgi:hypothetical protein